MSTVPAIAPETALATGKAEAAATTRVISALLQKTEEAEKTGIANDDGLAAAISLRSLIQTQKKDADEQRQRLGKPFREGLEALNAEFKSRIIDPLEGAKKKLDSLILGYQTKKEAEARAEAERQRREAEEKARAEREAAQKALDEAAAKDAAGDSEGAQAALDQAAAAEANAEVASVAATAPVVVERGPMRGIGAIGGRASIRTSWVFELDPALSPEDAIAKVPAAYLVPPVERLNAKVIRAAISGENGLREIPGLRIFEKKTVAG